MELKNQKLDDQLFYRERKEILDTWPTGAEVDLEEGIRYQDSLPESKVFSAVMSKAEKEGRVLLQPRAGVALVDEQIKLLRFLEEDSDLLPTTIDAYTRQNKYQDAEKGIQKSLQAGRSLLNGFPAVNHGVQECRRLIESVNKPVQVRHGTPDARLLLRMPRRKPVRLILQRNDLVHRQGPVVFGNAVHTH